MDILEVVKKLAQKARDEDAPSTDVAASVLARIRERQEPVTAPLWIFAAASAVAAAAVVVVTTYACISWNDPMAALFTQFRMVML